MTSDALGRYCATCGKLFYYTNRDPKDVCYCSIKCVPKKGKTR